MMNPPPQTPHSSGRRRQVTRRFAGPMCPAVFIAWRVCACPAFTADTGRQSVGLTVGSSSGCPVMGA